MVVHIYPLAAGEYSEFPAPSKTRTKRSVQASDLVQGRGIELPVSIRSVFVFLEAMMAILLHTRRERSARI
jgi:hypothetical protein